MIGSKQQTNFWYFPNFSIIIQMLDLFGRGLKELSFLCCPEDTTDNIGCRQTEITYRKAIGLRHVLKGVFWVIVSIAVSIVVGQLL